MHVIAHRAGVSVAAAIDNQRLVTPTEEVAGDFMPPIEPCCVGAEEPLHARHEVWHRCFHDQMKMIHHQTIPQYLPTGLAAHLAQRFQETLPVEVILENRLSAVTAVHDMVDRARILDSQLARHTREMVDKTKKLSILLTDPLGFLNHCCPK